MIERYSEAQIRFGNGEFHTVTCARWNGHPSPLPASREFVPLTHEYEMTMRLTKHVRKLREQFLAMSDPRFRTLLHVLRGCGPGGHKNSKASRRLLRAAWGCA